MQNQILCQFQACVINDRFIHSSLFIEKNKDGKKHLRLLRAKFHFYQPRISELLHSCSGLARQMEHLNLKLLDLFHTSIG